MTRKRWVYINGEAHEISDDYVPTPMVMADLPSFVSPIDGKTYSGRAGMREHCAKHNVVPLDEMKGVKPPDNTKQKRAEVRQAIIDACYRTRSLGFKP